MHWPSDDQSLTRRRFHQLFVLLRPLQFDLDYFDAKGGLRLHSICHQLRQHLGLIPPTFLVPCHLPLVLPLVGVTVFVQQAALDHRCYCSLWQNLLSRHHYHLNSPAHLRLIHHSQHSHHFDDHFNHPLPNLQLLFCLFANTHIRQSVPYSIAITIV